MFFFLMFRLDLRWGFVVFCFLIIIVCYEFVVMVEG